MQSQLSNDGHADIASMLFGRENIQRYDCPPMPALENFLSSKNESKVGSFVIQEEEGFNTDILPPFDNLDKFKPEAKIVTPAPCFYKTNYVTTHKEACISLAFSPNGAYLATGSKDMSIKIISTHRIYSRSVISSDAHCQDSHPVLKTVCEHTEPVTALCFHPTEQIIFSGSEKGSIKCFLFSKNKKPLQSINEVGPVKIIALHPAGRHMMVAINHPTSNSS